MQVHHRGCNSPSPGWEIVLTPEIRAWQALKPQADARLWRNETTEAEKTSTRPCTPAQGANAPLLHQGESSKHQSALPCPPRRAQQGQWLRARSWTLPERQQMGKSLLSLLCLCNTLSEESVALSSGADFAPRYKDSYCNISYSPSPPVPQVAKFTAVKVSLWLLRNLISEYDHSPSVLFRIFRVGLIFRCRVNPWARWVRDTFSMHPTSRDQGRVSSLLQETKRQHLGNSLFKIDPHTPVLLTILINPVYWDITFISFLIYIIQIHICNYLNVTMRSHLPSEGCSQKHRGTNKHFF